ncbi:hypothetical protein M404DRAFT_997922 [Pisolithus tinctorius Marx 270]|uniref:Uncharacterized protein n=1 Tax=Pisolithus tinctorius Marx 270 TaxID=870435 RepID=A0A0C3P409_PISTI|nr:hypothetical protein M404DRAFT_997922 [Pisolithus tinctorius Marx 270]
MSSFRRVASSMNACQRHLTGVRMSRVSGESRKQILHPVYVCVVLRWIQTKPFKSPSPLPSCRSRTRKSRDYIIVNDDPNIAYSKYRACHYGTEYRETPYSHQTIEIDIIP